MKKTKDEADRPSGKCQSWPRDLATFSDVSHCVDGVPKTLGRS